MKIVFASNYLSPHQLPFCLEMSKKEEVDFSFVATRPVGEERRILGYDDLDKKYPFVVCAYESDELMKKGIELVNQADVAIIGSAPSNMVKQRIKKNKITFRFSERQLKYGLEPLKYIYRFIRWRKNTPNKKNCLLLCASAYASYDFSLFGLYKNRAYKWGYFPETKNYADIDSIIDKKEENSILWTGRLIGWKHPETMLQLATELKNKGYNFHINIVGTGEMEDELKCEIVNQNLENEISMLGSKKVSEVRSIMEKSQIFVSTSNRQEGWGAVVNEAMNSGCAVVASNAVGAAPYLIQNTDNGLMYKDGDISDLVLKVQYLLDNVQNTKQIGKEAYKTIANEWNAENAAKRFVILCENLLQGNSLEDLFSEGICSRAEIIKG